MRPSQLVSQSQSISSTLRQSPSLLSRLFSHVKLLNKQLWAYHRCLFTDKKGQDRLRLLSANATATYLHQHSNLMIIIMIMMRLIMALRIEAAFQTNDLSEQLSIQVALRNRLVRVI